MSASRRTTTVGLGVGMLLIAVLVAASAFERDDDAPPASSMLEVKAERKAAEAGAAARVEASRRAMPSPTATQHDTTKRQPITTEASAAPAPAEAAGAVSADDVENGPKLSVELRFLGVDGAPIPELQIDVGSSAHPAEWRYGMTDAAGWVRILGWRPGIALSFTASRSVFPFTQFVGGRILGSSFRPLLRPQLDPTGEWLIGPPRERIVFYDGAFVRADVVVEPKPTTPTPPKPCVLRLSAASGIRRNFDETFEVLVRSASSRDRREWHSGRLPMEIRLEEGEYEVEADQIHAGESDIVGRQHLAVAHAKASVRVTLGTNDLSLEFRDTVIVKGRFVGPERSAIDAGTILTPIIDGESQPKLFFSLAIYDLFYVGFPEGTAKAELSLRFRSPEKSSRAIDCSERVRKARAGDVIDLGEVEIK